MLAWEAPQNMRKMRPYNKAAEGYAELAPIVRVNDEQWVAHYNFYMDMLLVFAALFSGILAAFNIQLYTSLQQDPQGAITHLLSQNFGQLSTPSSNASISPQYIQHLRSPADPPSFRALPINVQVNLLWFAALLCSLASSCTAMCIKGWLQAYVMQGTTVSSDKTLRRIRDLFRSRPFRWYMVAQGQVLIFLVLASLWLFLIGLAMLLTSINVIVGKLVLLMMITFYVVFTSGAAFCWVLWAIGYSSLYRNYSWWHKCRASCKGVLRVVNLWNTGTRPHSFDMPALLDIDRVLRLGSDQLLGSTLRKCVTGMDGHYVIEFVRGVLENRLGRPISTLDASFEWVAELRIQCLSSLMNILVDALGTQIRCSAKSPPNPEERKKTMEWMNEATRWLTYAMDYIERFHNTSPGKLALDSANILSFRRETPPCSYS